MEELIGDSFRDEDIREYLIFSVNSIDFGVDISFVQEIIQMQPIFKIPNSLESCKGIINMRGTIVPVIDMRLKLGYEPIGYDDKTCIIVIEVEAEQIGMIVDMVKDVIRIPASELINAPTMGGEVGAGLVENIATVDGVIKQILDVYSVFEISK